MLCYASTAGGDGRYKPREIFYELLLSFLADNSLEQARRWGGVGGMKRVERRAEGVLR